MGAARGKGRNAKVKGVGESERVSQGRKERKEGAGARQEDEGFQWKREEGEGVRKGRNELKRRERRFFDRRGNGREGKRRGDYQGAKRGI